MCYKLTMVMKRYILLLIMTVAMAIGSAHAATVENNFFKLLMRDDTDLFTSLSDTILETTCALVAILPSSETKKPVPYDVTTSTESSSVAIPFTPSSSSKLEKKIDSPLDNTTS